MASSVNSIAALLLWATVVAAQDKVNVAVYFESYCPDSVSFLTKQLYPTFLKLSDHMNITLVPYGKAMTNWSDMGEPTFTCHHGEKECKGNKAIACVLEEKNISFADQFKFINCTSSMIAANPKSEAGYPIDQCALGGIVGTKITACMDGEAGNKGLEMYGNKTKEAFPSGLESVPTVVFNDKFNLAEHKMAVSDFRKALCSKITGTKPAECTKSGANGLQAAILPLLATAYIASRV